MTDKERIAQLEAAIIAIIDHHEDIIVKERKAQYCPVCGGEEGYYGGYIRHDDYDSKDFGSSHCPLLMAAQLVDRADDGHIVSVEYMEHLRAKKE